jgi:hypothetical protein
MGGKRDERSLRRFLLESAKLNRKQRKMFFKQLSILVIRNTALSRNKTSSLAGMRSACFSDQNKRAHVKRGEPKSLRLHFENGKRTSEENYVKLPNHQPNKY